MAAEDKKISELNEITVDIDSMSNSIYIPIVYQGITLKVDLSKIITSIKSKIASITPYELDQPGEQIDLDTINAISNSLVALRSDIEDLKNESSWPKHTITLAALDRQMQYVLKTNPHGQSVDFTINTSDVLIPNFYATLNVGRPTISGNKVNVLATFSISNNYSNLLLEGGYIEILFVTGSVTIVRLGSTRTATLNGSLPLDPRVLLSNNSFETKPYAIDLSGGDIQSGDEIQSVELLGTVNGISIPGRATYSVSNNASFGANGYIVLS